MDLYYNNAMGDGLWENGNNWWLNSTHTLPATAYGLPQSGDNVYINAELTTGPATPITANNIFCGTSNTAAFNVNFGNALATFYQFNNNVTHTGTTVLGLYEFNGSSINSGQVDSDGYGSTFNDSSRNTGTVLDLVTFTDNSYNTGVCDTATFEDLSYNDGLILGIAYFNDTSYNVETVNGDAIFNYINTSATGIADDITSYASGNVAAAKDSFGTIITMWRFTTTDLSSGSICDGNAFFKNASTNEGTVTGNAYFDASSIKVSLSSGVSGAVGGNIIFPFADILGTGLQ
jgi:hypothetical protein